jgi:hypothetical protein
METCNEQAQVNMNFVRLLFTNQTEEKVAHRWAQRLAVLLGPAARQLRPETTLDEMLRWAASAGVDSMSFVTVFEPELGMAFAEFLEYSEHVTFREMVERYAGLFGS